MAFTSRVLVLLMNVDVCQPDPKYPTSTLICLPGVPKSLRAEHKKCNTAIATKAFFDLMFKEPVKVMLFGAACTHVTDPIAKASKHWRITQVTHVRLK
ncbi:hypothetical protein HAZT_HAZT005284 [Hyalella azteca]|uniref:Uncharacterized protein n=1 Tax=Hyalella azteca TaxID=294128 RepID=A0A6A0GTB8_HYAAZ|nr:hypothetical protein HAZT_HAZT005284 [Hyalella azteca]